MKIKKRICGTLGCLSFLWLIGVAGNSELGLEPDFGVLCIKVFAGLVVFVCSLNIGGFIE